MAENQSVLKLQIDSTRYHMASRFRQAHNAFDTGRISHPVGWTSGPLDDWHQYARDDFTRCLLHV